MKNLLFLLLLLPSLAQAQWFYADTLACSDSTVSKNFYGVTSLPEDAYQVWVTVVATDDAVDTIKVQQLLRWGIGPSIDSAWVTMKIVDPWDVDTLGVMRVIEDTIAVTRKIINSTATFAQFQIWSPFVGDRWRIVRNSPPGYKPTHALYWTIRQRYWGSR